jgi:hypothetical protein
MRKSILTLALAAVLGLAAVPAKAFFEANLSGGYTTLKMDDVNAALAAPGSSNATSINSGFYVAADAGIAVFPFLKIVPRVEYVQASQGKTTFGSGLLATDYTLDANIVPMELGLAVDAGLPLTGLSVRGGLFGGYGMATGMTVAKVQGVTTSTTLLQGGGFTAEAVADLRYEIFSIVSLGLDAGYRLANMAQMKDTSGNVYKKSNGDDMAFDFGGFNIGACLNVGF